MSDLKATQTRVRMEAVDNDLRGEANFILHEINGDIPWRSHIRRNFYDFQSYATVERWDGGKWRPVASVPIADLPIHRFKSGCVASDEWRHYMEDSLCLVFDDGVTALGNALVLIEAREE